MPCALVLGASGQLGHAVASHLAAHGWSVSAVARGGRPLDPMLAARGVSRISGDGRTVLDLIRQAGGPIDLLFDPTSYDAGDAVRLREAAALCGATVVVSSSSVYADAQGRTLDEAAVNGFPDFPSPIMEDNKTVPPGDDTYSRRKIAMERVLLDSGLPITVLRPCAIHGAFARHPREWWLVKRAIDGRTAIPIAYMAESRFHTSSARGIARLVECCAMEPACRVLNVADATVLTVAGIAEAVEAAIGTAIPLAPFEGPPVGHVGTTPWSTAGPFALDCSAAEALGWKPADYAEDVRAACEWMLAVGRDGDWRQRFDQFMHDGYDPFDYDAEDEFLRRRG